MAEIFSTCWRCGGTGKYTEYSGETCSVCNGSGVFVKDTLNLSDVEDKLNDIFDKCNDIFEKLNEV